MSAGNGPTGRRAQALQADSIRIPGHQNSGRVAQLLARGQSVGRSRLFRVTFGMKARPRMPLEPYKPVNWDQVAAGKERRFMDPQIPSGHPRPVVNRTVGWQAGAAAGRTSSSPTIKGMVVPRSVVGGGRLMVGACASLWRRRVRQEFDPATNSSRICGRNDPIVYQRPPTPAVVSARAILLGLCFQCLSRHDSEKGNFES